MLEVGFERLEPPEKLKGRGSVYQLLLPDDRQLILRGFGVFFGQLGVGGVFLPRFEFIPRYTKLSKLDSPPWTTDHLPTLQPLDQGIEATVLDSPMTSWTGLRRTRPA